MTGKCEFCTREAELSNGTTFHGPYCAECIRISIFEDRKALKNMNAKKQQNVDHDKEEKDFKESLKNLVEGPYQKD
jgi:hypothetical protein